MKAACSLSWPSWLYGSPGVTEVTDPIRDREESLEAQLAGRSQAVSADEAKAGIEAARSDLRSGKGSGYGIGFGYIKNFGSIGSQDGVTLCFAITDGEREANFHANVSRTQLATLEAHGENVDAWIADRLYSIAGNFERCGDRYLEILLHHPLDLG